MSKLYLVLMLLLASNCVVGQCASDYADNYAVRFCNDPSNVFHYNAVVQVVTPSKILISNFAGWDNQIISGDEDTIYANLNCTMDSLYLEPMTVTIPNAQADLHYTGSGILFPDSIRIVYHQVNPNGEQDICYTYVKGLYVDVEENRLNETSIYPNPATDNLRIESQTPLAQVKLTDLAGRVALQQTLKQVQGDVSIDVSTLPSGIYLLEAITEDSKRSVQKVVVR